MNATLAGDYRFCEDVTRASSSSFARAFRFLSPDQRRAMAVVYAFCRSVDDAVDEVPPEQAVHLLEDWREELGRAYEARATHPVTHALEDSLERFAIPKEALSAIIDGVEMDLDQSHYHSFDDLVLYCRRVASAVGLASIEIFGCVDAASRVYADRLGIALQLTNILRDLSEDVERGRVYLPEEDLERFGYAPSSLRFGVYNTRFRSLMEFECERTRRYYREAIENVPEVDRPRLVAAEAMRESYEQLLDRIVAEDYFVFGRRLSLSPMRKVALAARFWVRGAFG